jgi:hypothetical protein
VDLIGYHESHSRQLGEPGIIGRKVSEWQIDARWQLIAADRIVIRRLPIHPRIVLALVVNAAACS